MLEMIISPAFVAAAVTSACSVLATVAVMEWRLRRALGRARGQIESAGALHRAGPAPPAVQTAPAGVPAADRPESGGESGAVARPQAGGSSGPRPVPPVAVRPRIQMGNREQVIEFLRWMIGEGYCGRYPSEEWIRFYRDWACSRSIATMSDPQFLTLLGTIDPALVKRSRDRIKDRNGRVLRTSAGTPLRVTQYTLSEPRPPEAVAQPPRTRRAA